MRARVRARVRVRVRVRVTASRDDSEDPYQQSFVYRFETLLSSHTLFNSISYSMKSQYQHTFVISSVFHSNSCQYQHAYLTNSILKYKHDLFSENLAEQETC